MSYLLHPYLLNAVYCLLLATASPWLLFQALTKGKYREGFAAKFFGRVPQRTGDQSCVWLHAVSVGEVNLLATLINEIQRRRPDWQCVVSTTTMTGYALAKKKYAGLTVFYCPLDFSWAVKAAMARIRPNLLVLAELELWPNLIRAARRSGVQVAVVNGRLSERSFRGYQRLGDLTQQVLGQLGLIAVQNEEYAERFRVLGAPAEAIHITGSMKYDGAETDRNNLRTRQLRALASYGEDSVIFLAGSTQEPEEALALQTYLELRKDYPSLRLILVPRHPDRFVAVSQLLEASGVPWQRRSELTPEPPRTPKPVLLVDAVGELSAWWGMADVAYVGGSMGSRGGQNMIEPAAYGAAVAFGPNTRNFRDIVAAMLEERAAMVVHDGQELTAFVRHVLEDREFAAALGRCAKSLVARQLGATAKTVSLLIPLVESAASEPPQRRAA